MLVRKSRYRRLLHDFEHAEANYRDTAKAFERARSDCQLAVAQLEAAQDRIRELKADRKALRKENARLLDLLAGKQQLEHDNLATWKEQLEAAEEEPPEGSLAQSGLVDRIAEIWGDQWTPEGGWQLPGPHEPWPDEVDAPAEEEEAPAAEEAAPETT